MVPEHRKMEFWVLVFGEQTGANSHREGLQLLAGICRGWRELERVVQCPPSIAEERGEELPMHVITGYPYRDGKVLQ